MDSDAPTARRMRIGEAAHRVGLSIRTIRHYEEAGLIVPSARSEGGFRLYTEDDLGRLATAEAFADTLRHRLDGHASRTDLAQRGHAGGAAAAQ